MPKGKITTEDVRKYKGVVTHVVDGDTFVIMNDYGMDLYSRVRIRMARIEAPATDSKDETVKAAGIKAMNWLRKKIMGKTLYYDSKKWDKYKRSIADVYFEGGTEAINDMIVKAGLAKYKKF